MALDAVNLPLFMDVISATVLKFPPITKLLSKGHHSNNALFSMLRKNTLNQQYFRYSDHWSKRTYRWHPFTSGIDNGIDGPTHLEQPNLTAYRNESIYW